MGVLIDVCGFSPARVAEILKEKARSGDSVAAVVSRMGLVSSRQLARLIAQYFELPLVDPTFDPSVALDLLWEPIDFVLDRGLIPVYIDEDALVVVGDCVPVRETVCELEELFGRDVKLKVCDSESLAESLRKLRSELQEIKELGPADCSYDKERFLRFCRVGWAATVAERFAGGIVRYQYAPGSELAPPVLTKTIEGLHESEPLEMVELLVGKSMSCEVTSDLVLRELTAGLLTGIRHFEGELKEAIFELRLAQLIIDEEGPVE